MKSIFIKAIFLFILVFTLCKGQNAKVIKLANPVSNSGTISFTLKTDSALYNGNDDIVFKMNLVELPGLGNCVLKRFHNFVSIQIDWTNKEEFTAAYFQTHTLPGPAGYHFIFTWESGNGLFDGYLNGINFRTEQIDYYEPWTMIGSSDTLIIPECEFSISSVDVFHTFTSEAEAINLVPRELFGQHKQMIEHTPLPSPRNVADIKGELIYSSRLNNAASVEGWVLEGPAAISFENESMILESTLKTPQNGSDGHFNIWCPEDLPENFIAEWEYQQLSDRGISLLFFSGSGKNGEDVFDTTLVKRDGYFQPYVNGDINNYWIVLFSNNRTMRMTNMAKCYLAKSSKSTLLSQGKLGIAPGNRKFHKIRLIKDRGHIQFQVDDDICIDFTDPGNERWGPVLGAGKLSFRQMAVTIAAYKNFNVWSLE